MNATHYETFYEYFAIKYNILIGNLEQPLLVVSHPSTRLNLLTPRYMNMRASVIQKSFHQHHHHHHAHPSSTQGLAEAGKKPSSNKIFLVPELVNMHPFKASVLRICMCLPSILYRLNSLLVVEEFRREIAQSTGVGTPWFNETKKVDKLSFEWDKNKEIEISEMPDLEMDMASIKQQQQQQKSDEENELHKEAAWVDPKWNFEISEWDDSVLSKSMHKENPNTLFELNYEPKNLRTLILNNENGSGDGGGWSEEATNNGDAKTLFIDPNDMEFFVNDEDEDEFDNSDEEAEFNSYKNINKKPYDSAVNTCQPDKSNNNSFSDSVHEDEESDSAAISKPNPAFKFTIDLHQLKADMKKKSAKLLSKLSGNSNNCSLVKNLMHHADKDEATQKSEFNRYDTNKLSDLGSFYLDLNTFGLNDYLADKSKQQKADKPVLLDEQKENETACHLNDWFEKIEIKVDLNNESLESGKVIQNIRKKLLRPETTTLSESGFGSLYSSSCKKINLPLTNETAGQLMTSDKCEKTPCEIIRDLSRITGTTTTSFRNTDWSFNFTLDQLNEIDNQKCPGPGLLLQALTLANAADGFDLERLETVGDSFLKVLFLF